MIVTGSAIVNDCPWFDVVCIDGGHGEVVGRYELSYCVLVVDVDDISCDGIVQVVLGFSCDDFSVTVWTIGNAHVGHAGVLLNEFDEFRVW